MFIKKDQLYAKLTRIRETAAILILSRRWLVRVDVNILILKLISVEYEQIQLEKEIILTFKIEMKSS